MKFSTTLKKKIDITFLCIMLALTNIYTFNEFLNRPDELFFWPRRIENGVWEFPSITILLPLWLGLNALILYLLKIKMQQKQSIPTSDE